MKYKSQAILCVITLILASCIESKTKIVDLVKTIKIDTFQKVEEMSEEREQFLYDSLSGKIPRADIRPFVDSLQGKITPKWQTPEIWKLKRVEALAMLSEWEEKHNDHTSEDNSIPYSDYVNFYGDYKEFDDVNAIKTAMFKRYPDFHLEIIPESITVFGEGNIERVEFTKKVLMNGKKSTYKSFLEFGGTKGVFFIVGEGDILKK